MKKLLLLLLVMSSTAMAQPVQTVRGVVRDRATAAPLPYASVNVTDVAGKGVATYNNGRFIIESVPVGRHTIEVSMVGYETTLLREVLVTSGRELLLEIDMDEQIAQVDEVVVVARVNKEQPLNTTALTGARMFSVDETQRFAGGVDDPGRVVSAFAGVSADVSETGISIHGNAPDMLQWRLEGVEIPNPNHFSDITSFGGGVMSALSIHTMGNSDFMAGALPAEYDNAIAGVFDMNLRKGNNFKHEHTVQLGMMGIDLASEGPLSKKKNASYLFNYRYSTLGLLMDIDPSIDMNGDKIKYQDLNFKLNLPTEKAGTFTVWGLGYIDEGKNHKGADPTTWEFAGDNRIVDIDQTVGALGVGHNIRVGTDGYLKTTLAATTVDMGALFSSLEQPDLILEPENDLKRRNTRLVATSAYNHRFSARHTNRTGFTYTHLFSDISVRRAPFYGDPLQTISEGKGNTGLINVFSNSTINITDRLSANIGVSGQWLTLNDSWSIEPRVGVKYRAGERTTLSAAYGLHSRMENMEVYYARTPGGELRNKDLDLVKSHHLMLSWAQRLGENTTLRIEPFYQQLFNLPVEPGTSYSTINRLEYWVEVPLESTGKGRNYGVDFTLEQYLTRGYYYLLSGSVFKSEYRGGDDVWHNTRFDRGYVLNALGGREWTMGKRKRDVLSANLRFTLQGGERYTPLDEAATLADPDHENKYIDSEAFTRQYDPMFIVNATVSYRMNRDRVAHEFGFAAINLSGTKERYGHGYKPATDTFEEIYGTNAWKNIFYRVSF